MPPDAADEDLDSYLQRLHVAAGRPTVRAISQTVGFSHTRVHDYLTGGAASAKWPRLSTLVTHFGGDTDHAKRLWGRAVQQRQRRRRELATPPNTHIAARLERMETLLAEVLDEIRGHRQVSE